MLSSALFPLSLPFVFLSSGTAARLLFGLSLLLFLLPLLSLLPSLSDVFLLTLKLVTAEPSAHTISNECVPTESVFR